MSTVLVTGGAGFLGSHLCDRLIERGDDVICVDNFFTGSKENVRHLIGHPRFELIRHDIVHPLYVEADRIFNLACPASPEAYQYNPIKTIKTSTVGMVNIMGLAKRCGARVLHASTSEVYGDPLVHPQTEDYWGHVNPIGPRSCYDEGKRIAESLMVNYHQEHGTEIRIIRIFNTYGPRMAPDDGRVVSNFIMQALKGEDLTVYGDGLQTRSFCYCDDLIAGMMRLMDQDEHTGPINIGNPVENTMLELAEAVIKVTGACTLSREPYPFPDIWDPLARVFDAWGLDRCLWGTDWTRAFAVVNYEQAVEPFLKAARLSDTERATLMGGACAKAYGWSPKKA